MEVGLLYRRLSASGSISKHGVAVLCILIDWKAILYNNMKCERKKEQAALPPSPTYPYRFTTIPRQTATIPTPRARASTYSVKFLVLRWRPAGCCGDGVDAPAAVFFRIALDSGYWQTRMRAPWLTPAAFALPGWLADYYSPPTRRAPAHYLPGQLWTTRRSCVRCRCPTALYRNAGMTLDLADARINAFLFLPRGYHLFWIFTRPCRFCFLPGCVRHTFTRLRIFLNYSPAV